MDDQVKFLISSVEKSLKNLQNKKGFLIEQQLQYNNIHDRLKTFKSNKDSDDISFEDTNEDDGGSGNSEGVKGLILGDVIISSKKCYLNLGYEYYVEKDFDEVLDFVNDKLSLMSEAIEQFTLKIKEAETTLQNLKDVSDNINEDVDKLDDFEEFDTEFPTMEIREELDDEGNIINSSIRPTNLTKKEQIDSNKIEELNEGGEDEQEEKKKKKERGDDFESNLRGKLLKNNIINNNNEDISGDSNTHKNKIDSDNIYTFADLVQQMEEQDNLEDGELEESDIDFDYDKIDDYIGNLNIRETEEEEEGEEEDYEDDSYMFDGHMTIVPGLSGQSSFMEQIAKLRAQRNSVDNNSNNSKVVNDDDLNNGEQQCKKENIKPLKKSANTKIETKSILKTGSDVNKHKKLMENDNTKKKTKKSVGFAAQLDIHEVENFKEETKRQTHNLFPSMQQLMYSNLVGVKDEDMVDDTNNPNVNDFDSDLFASMLGIKGAEEIHDKYSDIVETDNISNDNNGTYQKKVTAKPKRISRFKKDILGKNFNKYKSINQHEDSNSNNGSDEVCVSTDIVEKDIIEEIPKGSDKILENKVVECRVINDIIEKDIIEKNVIDESSFSSNIIEKTDIGSNGVDTITSRSFVENMFVDSKTSNNKATKPNETNNEITQISNENKVKSLLFQKKMTSLQRPRTKQQIKQSLITSEMLDAYEELEISSNEPKQEEPKIVELLEDKNDNIGKKVEELIEDREEEQKEDGIRDVFPEEIKNAISQMGKSENDVHVANVDYSALNNNLDDMVKAYTLGLYDDDLEEHPGTVLEKIEDFTNYNRQVETLKDVIKDFQRNNPMKPDIDEELKDDNDFGDCKIMADKICERDIPEDYCEVEENSASIINDDYGLNVDNLQDAVNLEYHKLKETLLPKLQEESRQFFGDDNVHAHNNGSTSEMGLEPIDADGNPIKVSRFKSQRMKLNI